MFTEGNALTVTFTEPAATQLFASDTVTAYVPDMFVWALVNDGFACALVKPFGPVQM